MTPSVSPTGSWELVAPAVPRRVADLIVEQLVRRGIRVAFGLPGGAISPVHDALLLRSDIETITTRHEADAMFAACGYARATGLPAAVVVTSGPGLTNAMTGLATAQLEQLPLVLLAGEAPRKRHAQNALQEGSPYGLDVISMTRSVTKHAVELLSPSGAPALVEEALSVCMDGIPGPVLITVPLDISTTRSRGVEIHVHRELAHAPDHRDVVRASRLLGQARRPVIFAGAGVRSPASSAALRQLAEKLNIPVMTTPKGKGVFPEGHPLSLGIFGLGGHASTADHLRKPVDVILAVGTSLGELATSGWSPLLSNVAALIHVDRAPRQICRSLDASIGLVGDAAEILDALTALTPAPQLPDQERRGCGRKTAQDPLREALGPEGRISSARAVWELQAVMPDSTCFVSDIGEHMLYALHYLRIDCPEKFMVMLGLGSMGSGIGAAVGAAVADPSRPVACICGDGGFLMSPGCVATAVVHQLPIVFAIFNDQRYGMVELGHEAVYGRRPHYAIGEIDVPSLARGLGASSLTITRPDEISSVAVADRLLSGPLVLDIHIDRELRMPQNTRNEFIGTAADHGLVHAPPAGPISRGTLS